MPLPVIALPLIGSVSYGTIATVVANVGLTAWQISEIWGDDDPGSELAAEQPTDSQVACLETYGATEPLTPGARAYYVKELAGWKNAARSELTSQIAIKSFDHTVSKLAALYQSETDSAGIPVGLCHVYAGTQVLQKMMGSLKSKAPAEIPPLELQGVASAPKTNRVWAVAALLAAVAAGFYLWRNR